MATKREMERELYTRIVEDWEGILPNTVKDTISKLTIEELKKELRK